MRRRGAMLIYKCALLGFIPLDNLILTWLLFLVLQVGLKIQTERNVTGTEKYNGSSQGNLMLTRLICVACRVKKQTEYKCN